MDNIGASTPKYIELGRRFGKVPDNPREDENSYLLVGRNSIGWDELEEYPRVVLLAGAGAGKTSELEHRAQVLASQGKAAFFIRLNELSATSLAAACKGQGDALDKWRKDTSPGWFFLDARDEVTVSDTEFYKALTNAANGIGGALPRARIFITSRPASWQYATDRANFDQILPAPEGVVEAPIAVAAPVSIDEDDQDIFIGTTPQTAEKTRSVVFRMNPLDKGQIIKLAGHFGVADINAFQLALERHDAYSLASRPGDLKGIVRLWLQEHDFKSYEEVVASAANNSLEDLRKIPGIRISLAVDEYAAGARRLAATMVLGRGVAFRVENDSRTDHPRSEIRPDEAFADWHREHLQAVLNTRLFELKGTNLVQFQNRTIKEYLAARWVLNIRDTAGLLKIDLNELFFSDIYGESLAIPSMEPIAAWVAARDDRVLSGLLARSPQTLMEYGDPGQLDYSTKIKLLDQVITATLANGSLHLSTDARIFRALAVKELVPQIRQHWDRASKITPALEMYQEDAQVILLKLIQYGNLQELAHVAYTCATRKGSSWSRVIFALRAMIDLKRVQDLRKFTQYLIDNAKRLDRQLVLVASEDLYPEYLTTKQVMNLVDAHEKAIASIDIEPEHTLSSIVKLANTTVLRMELLGELTNRWRKLGPGSDEMNAYSEKTPRRWLVPAILRISRRIFREDPGLAITQDQLLAVAGSAMYSQTYLNRKEVGPAMRALFEAVGRERVFWTLLENMEQWHPHARMAKDLAHAINLIAFWMGVEGEDLSWLLGVVPTERREAAIRAALVVWRSMKESAEILSRIKKSAEGDPVLLTIIGQYTDTTESAEMRELRKESARIAQEHKARKEKQDKQWDQFRDDLKSHPEWLTDDAPANANRRFNVLRNLYAKMTEAGKTNRNMYAVSNWRVLASEYGQEVAEAAAKGFMAYWRTVRVKLPSELQGLERNQMPVAGILSLTGLAIEAVEKADWIKSLKTAEVETAARHAFRELNGFPPWILPLAEASPDILNNMVEKEIRLELEDPDENAYPSLLSRLPREEVWRWPGLVGRVVKVLASSKSSNIRAFRYAIDLLIRGGNADSQSCRALYRKKLDLKRERQEHKIGYLAGWFALDATAATEALFGLLKGKAGKEKDQIVEEVFASLSGEFRHGPIPFGNTMSIRTLEKLVGIAYSHIRQEEDIEHDGVYSPGRRDNAETGRSYVIKLLAETSGQAAYEALQRLARKFKHTRLEEMFLRLSRKRALEDSERYWLPKEVLAFERDKVLEPKRVEDLYKIAVRRLTEIKEDLEGGKFSQKDLLTLAGDKERHYQIWLAGQLSHRARGLYKVEREPEVIDAKKPDVAVISNNVSGMVPIEVKVLESWSFSQLRHALQEQLMGQYLRDPETTHGILLLINRKQSTIKHIRGKRIRGIDDISHAIQEAVRASGKIGGKVVKANVLTMKVWV